MITMLFYVLFSQAAFDFPIQALPTLHTLHTLHFSRSSEQVSRKPRGQGHATFSRKLST